VQQFGEQLFADCSTPAHRAVAEIVEAKPKAVVFTENIDYKHEAEGSRVSVVHMDAGHEVHTKVKLRANEAKLLITVALSKDDRAVIQYLKQTNPELKIVALTLKEDTIPDYLGKNDAVVIGDCQKFLPQIVTMVKG